MSVRQRPGACWRQFFHPPGSYLPKSVPLIWSTLQFSEGDSSWKSDFGSPSSFRMSFKCNLVVPALQGSTVRVDTACDILVDGSSATAQLKLSSSTKIIHNHPNMPRFPYGRLMICDLDGGSSLAMRVQEYGRSVNGIGCDMWWVGIACVKSRRRCFFVMNFHSFLELPLRPIVLDR